MKERQSGLGNDEKILMLHKEYQKLDKKLEDIARTVEQNQLEDCFFNILIRPRQDVDVLVVLDF